MTWITLLILCLLSTQAWAAGTGIPCGVQTPPVIIGGIETPGFQSCTIGMCYNNDKPFPGAQFSRIEIAYRQNAYGGFECVMHGTNHDSDPTITLPGSWFRARAECLPQYGVNAEAYLMLNAQMQVVRQVDAGCWSAAEGGEGEGAPAVPEAVVTEWVQQ